MNRSLRDSRIQRSFRPVIRGAMIYAALMVGGCTIEPPKPPPPKLANLPPREGLAEFMKGTLYEVTDLQNDSPFLVSGWGLVVNLNGTGGSNQISNNLKAFMQKQLEAKGFGRLSNPALKGVSPEMVLADKNVAVVGVYGFLPPGARKGQSFDIRIMADQPNREEVSSLARGQLYETLLTIDGANPLYPAPPVNVWAKAAGPVFVNPAVATRSNVDADPATKRSLRAGTIIGGGQVATDRPLQLRIRQPEKRLARTIEYRINDYFHRDKVCSAFNEAFLELTVPREFQEDWEHFSKVVLHIYLQGGSEAFSRTKARELAAEARKPNAPLQDISYCWEGLGKFAMPELSALMADATASPTVRFAAARAAAYIGDPSGAAEKALFDFASDGKSDLQLAAVQVLGRVPNSRAVNQLIRDLLDSPQSTVRVEAYRILARNHDLAVETRIVGSARDSSDQKFALDFVHSRGAPLIYATCRGIPRIAIFGNAPKLTLPITFASMDNHLMVSSQRIGRDVTIFYRDAQVDEPVILSSPSDLVDVIMRLAGQIDDGSGHQLDFTYAEVLAVLQGLTDQQKLRVTMPTGDELAAAFVVQEAAGLGDAIDNAPRLDRSRPDGDNGTTVPRIDAPASPAQGRPTGPIGMASDGSAVTGK